MKGLDIFKLALLAFLVGLFCFCGVAFSDILLHISFFIDINECERRPCGVNANCVNTPESYLCVCKNGFTGNGESCQGTVLSVQQFIYKKILYSFFTRGYLRVLVRIFMQIVTPV